MNSGEGGDTPPVAAAAAAVTNARSIQHEESLAVRKQQVATIVVGVGDRPEATAAHLQTNLHHHHHYHHQQQQQHHNSKTLSNGGEWHTVVRLNGGSRTTFAHNANDIVMDGSFQQHVPIAPTNSRAENGPNGGSPVIWPRHENYAPGSEPPLPHVLTHGNGEIARIDSPNPPSTSLEGEGGPAAGTEGNNHQQIAGSLVMRDPQESHHRSAPAAAPALGEVESGEDDSDCAVVVAVSTERKVEPLKINLARDREPLRTIIKRTPGTGATTAEGVGTAAGHFQQQLSPTIRDGGVPSSPKITIKPPKPPAPDAAPVVPGSSVSASSSSASDANCTVPVYSSIPKLTIKPVINPSSASENAGETSSPSPLGLGEQMQIIPKLLIKASSESSGRGGEGRDGAGMEPHIVPKLTIRGVNNHNHHHHHNHHPPPAPHQLYFPSNHHHPAPMVSPSASVQPQTDGPSSNAVGGGNAGDSGSSTPLVPKLTIKMDNYHPHLHHHHHHNNLRVTDGGAEASGGGPPIPKLHIKTIPLTDGGGGGGVASIASSLSPATSAGTSNSTFATGNCSTSAGGGQHHPPVLTSSEGVKLTIKPLPEPPKLPKLTIKTTGLGTIAETSDASLVSSTSNSFSPKAMPLGGPGSTGSGAEQQHHVLMMGGSVPQMLLHQHQPHQPASPSDQHSNISSSSIPKLTIKPIPNCSNAATVDGGSGASLMVTEAPTVPKLTIKPIPPPVKQPGEDSSSSSSETSINSLESSPVSSSSISSVTASVTGAVTTSPQTALKMTIKVPPPSVPHENASAGGSSSLVGGVPRLNIKPILPPAALPTDGVTGAGSLLSAGGMSEMNASVVDVNPPVVASSEEKAIVIPKVTIKTLAHPRGQETEILSTPKVTLKPIPKPSDDGGTGCGSPAAHSPTASSAPTVDVANDSRRIILKINKGSDGVAFVPPTGGNSILANELKRPASDRTLPSLVPSSSSSSLSSSVSCASSTSVSASATSSSAGSDPASPSSIGGGSAADHGEPDSPEAKKSKLDLTQMQMGSLDQQQQQQQYQQLHHNELIRQTMLQSQQYQLQQRQSAAADVGSMQTARNVNMDVIVIDDDSKSENETSKGDDAKRVSATTFSADPLSTTGDRGVLDFQHHMTMYPTEPGTTGSPTQGKARRTRGTPRGSGASSGGGGRQSRRGTGRSAATKPANAVAMPQLLGLLEQDDREEGSSSDCMIVDDPATANVAHSTALAGGALTLENLLRGGGSKLSNVGGTNFYGNYAPMPPASVGGGSDVDKNGTASNSSIGSVTSSVSGSAAIAPPTTPTAGGRTPTAGVRMSTRRAAGQLLKEVLANKHQDRDSGVDEARTDGENGSGTTPSKRTRGRPKRYAAELAGVVDTNGAGGSSSSQLDGGHPAGTGSNVGGLVDGTTGVANNNILLAMAMMSGGSAEAAAGLLASQQLLGGIVPLPSTPTTRTPRTRGRGRGRGRGKMTLADGSNTFIGGIPFHADTNSPDGNADPLFIGTPNNVDPSTPDPTPNNFHLLFNLGQTPRGGSTGGRTRAGRRGAGRGPRGGGRGAAKAAMAALLAAGATPSEIMGSFASAAAGSAEKLESLQLTPLAATNAMNISPKPRGRGRGSRGGGVGGTGPGSRRKGARGTTGKAARSRKGLELLVDGDEQLSSGVGGTSAEVAAATAAGAAAQSNAANNAIFMTPMAGGLDPNRPKLHVRELKTPKNAIKSNTPPSSAQATPSAGTTPSGTPAGTPAPEVFEEDTRMSSDFNFTTPVRLLSSGDGCLLQQNDESQSSYLSSTSVTLDATNQSAATSATATDASVGAAVGVAVGPDGQKDPLSVATSASNSNSSSVRRNKGKMEVLDSHRAQFTVDLLAEYEWPPPSPGTRGADTFMIQEQIAEYLGVKSFKRKYPDLMRRPVDMEERNFILEQGLASEKMCDLGLTAVYASEILDIMCTDYPEKYEEYTRYTREKHFRELSNRQRQQQEAISGAAAAAVVAAAPIDRVQLQKEKAMESAANWNCSFNKERRDSRRACMDLQTYVVQVPKRQQATKQDGPDKAPVSQHSNYPVALVPGQFSEYYTTFTPEELACYPINTILLDPFQLREIVSSERYRKLVAAEDARLARARDSSSCSSSSGSDSSDDSSSDDEDTSSNDGSSSSSNSGSSSSSDDEADGQSGSSATDSECEGGGTRIKKKHRRKRKLHPTGAFGVGGGPPQPAGALAAVTPVRRSSRTSSSGVPLVAMAAPTPAAVPAIPIVECKEPTDSDDSDVPLIAHAVKKKNNNLLSTASGGASVAAPPSAGGGKRMQDTVATPVKRPPLNPFLCAVCLGPENKNRYSKPELFVRCNRCRRKAHPSCIGMSSVMYRRVQQYKWQCSECKLCMKCNQRPAAIDSKMVYCDQCDRGYHLACKGLRNLPDGRWHCSLCTICGLCGAQTPEGHPNPQLSAQQRQQLAMVAEWTHEYGLNELTKIREHLRTLCVPCVRQRRQPQQQQQQQQPVQTPLTGGSSSSETIALLNNNNTTLTVDPNKPQLMVPTVGGGVVISMKPQLSQSAPSIIHSNAHTIARP